MEVLLDATLGQRQIVLGLASSFLFWFSFYNVLCLRSPSRSYEWHCRVVTFTHAVIVTSMSFIFGMYFNPWLFTDPGGPNTVYEVLTLTVCLGYFLFDFLWCLWFWGQESSLMLVHHVLSITALVVSLAYGISGTEVNGVIFGSEVSNPLLQFRWFMRETGHTGTWYYEVNDFLFMLTFFVCRTCIGTYFLYTHFNHPRPSKFFKIGGIGMYLVSWCFLLGILNFAYYKYSKLYRKWIEKRTALNGVVKKANGTTKPMDGGIEKHAVANGSVEKYD